MKQHRARTSQGGGRSQRQLRAGELVRHALADILSREDLRDPELAGVSVTVSEVRASPDLKHMTVFVAPLAAGDARAIAVALNRAAGFVRGKLARAVTLRFAPELHFQPDLSFEEARHVDELLQTPEVKRDLAPPPRAEASGGGAPREARAAGASPPEAERDDRPLSHATRDSSPASGGANEEET